MRVTFCGVRGSTPAPGPDFNYLIIFIGAGVGALAGHEIAGSGDRTLGAILGGAVGALVGREIDRGSLQCR